MKHEIWRYYDHLRRWGLLFLLGLALGALGGAAYYEQQPQEFRGLAEFRFPREDFSLWVAAADFETTEQAAVKPIVPIAVELEQITRQEIKITRVSIDAHRVAVAVWWKLVLFGSVLGGLLVIGGSIIWDQALRVEREQQQ